MRSLVIFGAGGFGQEAAWVAESMNDVLSPADRWEILGYVDDNAAEKGNEYYGHRVIESPGDLKATGRELWYHCALGNNLLREKISKRLDGMGWKAATLIHPSVIVAKYVRMGEGCYVGAYSILSPNAVIGRHVLINQRASIGHDAHLEDFSQACPGAQINGYCMIRRGALIGSNASIQQGRAVGEHAVVGSNSQVLRSVPDRSTAAGVPATVFTLGHRGTES